MVRLKAIDTDSGEDGGGEEDGLEVVPVLSVVHGDDVDPGRHDLAQRHLVLPEQLLHAAVAVRRVPAHKTHFLQEIVSRTVENLFEVSGLLHLVRVLQQLEDLGPEGGVAGEAHVQPDVLQNCLKITFKTSLR